MLGQLISKLRNEHWSVKYDIENIIKDNLSIQEDTRPLRILFAPSFAIYKPSFLNEQLIATILKEMGHQVVPILCDSAQVEECNIIGGSWGKSKNRERSCKNCHKEQSAQWAKFEKKYLLSSYWDNKKHKFLKSEIASEVISTELEFSYNNIPFGYLAGEILANNYQVSDVSLIHNYQEKLLFHILNLIMLDAAYDKIIAEFQPDRAFSNDTYYGMWHLFETKCIANNIPSYNFWPATKDRVAFSKGAPSMYPNFGRVWERYRVKELTAEEIKRVDNWIAGNRLNMFDPHIPSPTKNNGVISFDNKKPTALLAANISWDLSALNKQIIFTDMADWICETIKWFERQPDFQLVVKVHPLEVGKGFIPQTPDSVSSMISKCFDKLPHNVIFLDANTTLTVSGIIDQFNLLGCVVHTSTVGYELPLLEYPSITTAASPYRGLGFTIDPCTKNEYFNTLKLMLLGKLDINSKISKELAYKYVNLYFFTHFMSLNGFVGTYKDLKEHQSLRSDLANAESNIRRICDTIISGVDV